MINNTKIPGKHLKKILTSLASRVDLTFEEVNWKDPGFRKQAKWTEDEMDDFKRWVTNYITTKKEAQKELFNNTKITKEEVKLAVDLFTYYYGWELYDNE